MFLTFSRNKSKPSGYQRAKAFREFTINTRRRIKDTVLISAGIFSAAFGFKGFLLSNHFIDEGGYRHVITDFSSYRYPPLHTHYLHQYPIYDISVQYYGTHFCH